jgi:hypothetical protein
MCIAIRLDADPDTAALNQDRVTANFERCSASELTIGHHRPSVVLELPTIERV